MWRTFSYSLLLLLSACGDPYARSYSRAVQNQMIEADDEDEANIAALQSRVDSMNTRITVLERDNDLQQSEIAALMNVVNAEEKLGDARDTEGRSQK